jgi:hypothetical protein
VPDARLAAVPDSRLAAVPDSRLAAVPDSRLAAVPDSRLAAVVFAARLTGADPLADFAAPAECPAFAGGAFLAGVLVALRFTGSSVAGRAFVAATYTLSSAPFRWAAPPHGVGSTRAPSKSVGYIEYWRLISPLSVCGRR